MHLVELVTVGGCERGDLYKALQTLPGKVQAGGNW